MKIISGLSKFDRSRYPGLALAVGNFDGVHLGHQKIISELAKQARKVNGVVALMTFRQHPRNVLGQNETVSVLTSLLHRLVLLEEAGVELLFLEKFTRRFAKISPERFLKNVLVQKLGVSTLCLGPDAHFGRGRRGNFRFAHQISEKGVLNLLEIGGVKKLGVPVSSTRIRGLIRTGQIEKVHQLFGRLYSFWGDVVHGKGRGRKMGFPTVNLKPQSEVMPPEGIYTSWIRSVKCELVPNPGAKNESVLKKEFGRFYPALMSFGRRPTFEKHGKQVPEVYILDFNGSFKAKTVEVVIGKWLRAEKKYPSPALLCRQIEIDVKNAKKWFNKHKMK